MHRRAFLAKAAAAVRWGLGAALALPGLLFVIAPPGRARARKQSVRLARMDAIPDDRPVCVTVAADRWDAYIHYPSGPIGRVWMLRTDAAGGDGVFRCFQAICPHLGCLIEYSPGRGTFHCPCHASAFDKDGQRLFGPSPRDMDPLPLRVTEPDDDGHRWVEVDYQEFETGVAERRPVA